MVYGEMLEALVEDTQSKELRGAVEKVVASVQQVPSVTLSAGASDAISAVIVFAGERVVEAEKAHAIKRIVPQTKPAIDQICDTPIRDFDFQQAGLAVDLSAATEALHGAACRSCVERVTYDDWLKARGDIRVWHGRVHNVDARKRAAIADVAKQQLNKPYCFFNSDLMDDSGFYCPKLLWYSVMKSTDIALDDNPDGRRFIWFSPLQAMRSKNTVELLSSPENYRKV